MPLTMPIMQQAEHANHMKWCGTPIRIRIRWIVPAMIVVAVFFSPKQFNNCAVTVNNETDLVEEKGAVYQHDTTDLPTAVECTNEQRNQISKSLNLGSIGLSCPQTTWIEDYYKENNDGKNSSNSGGFDPSSFLGISVGCNKGHDAIRTARMGMSDPQFDGPAWKVALDKIGGNMKGACRAETSEQTVVIHPKREGEMHCIEPMPSTYLVLHEVGTMLDMENKKFIIRNAAISSSNGKIKFPLSKAGTEYEGIHSCINNPTNCIDVPMYTLDTYVKKFVKGTGPVDILQIDVEGWDFDVLFGAGPVLDRTNYLEFEYHSSGPWGNLHLQDAIKLLDRKGFTCYWSGRSQLWKITECYSDVYDRWHGWSNVACVHRKVAPLASRMEQVFLSTIS